MKTICMMGFLVAVTCLHLASCGSDKMAPQPSRIEEGLWVQCESAKMRSRDLLKILSQDPDKAFGPAMEMGSWLSLCGSEGKLAKESIEKAFLANNGPDIKLLEKAFREFSGS